MSLEPSLDVAVVLLAVQKVGATFVPLEPTYPAARIRTILEDTMPTLVVTSASLAAKLPFEGHALFLVDDDIAKISALSSDDLGLPIDLERTAYVYYTSGTTGKPKGVMASYANLAHYILRSQERYAIARTDIMPAIARFSFSISMFELMSPLAAGGTLVVLERDHVLDPARMAKTFSEVTFFHAGPSLLRGVLAQIRKAHATFEAFEGVRHASSGGDMVPPELLESMKEIFSRAEVFVIYGSSEISCMGCTYPVSREHRIERTYVGRPFDNVIVRVLDEDRQPVPFGVVGEICFAGDGVVKGYLNRPELTEQKFFTLEGRRFYGMGDMGRVSFAGNVEILGRRDFQIQLRGMRIELGEIDATLRKGPGVREAISMAREGDDGEKILVGYVVFAADADPDVGAVRKHMVDHLPDYMVPARIVPLANLPLNSNMKIDRHALPSLSELTETRGPHSRVPTTQAEKELASLWQSILRIDQVSKDDNFFELGGHSILALKLLQEAKKAHGITLDGMDVLRESLETLAAIIDRERGMTTPAQRGLVSPAAEIPVEEAFFFGPEHSLYGVHHSPARTRKGERRPAVLFAPAFGYEATRSSFVTTRIARRLASAGIPVLRFDYFGTGNSHGRSIDGSVRRWKEDVAFAARELERLHPNHEMVIVGARLGALLAVNARSGNEGQARLPAVSRWILWEPIDSGRAYVDELERLHAACLRGLQHLRLGRLPRVIASSRELVGTTFSKTALRELRALDWPRAPAHEASPTFLAPIHVLAHADAHEALQASNAQILAMAHDPTWTDARAMENLLPDVGISDAILEILT